MGLKVVIEPLRQISSDIWEGMLSAEDLEIFNKPEFHEGDVSILLVKNPIRAGEGRLEFKPEYARVLNSGDSDKTLIIGMFGENRRERERDIGNDAENERIVRETTQIVKEW